MENNQYQNQAQEKAKSDNNGFGIASLVLGCCSVLLFPTCINFILIALSVVFAVLQILRNRSKSMAIAALCACGLSLILSLIMWGMVFYMGFSEAIKELPDREFYEEYYDDFRYNEIQEL